MWLHILIYIQCYNRRDDCTRQWMLQCTILFSRWRTWSGSSSTVYTLWDIFSLTQYQHPLKPDTPSSLLSNIAWMKQDTCKNCTPPREMVVANVIKTCIPIHLQFIYTLFNCKVCYPHCEQCCKKILLTLLMLLHTTCNVFNLMSCSVVSTLHNKAICCIGLHRVI